MKANRPRFSLRSMMAAVAAVAVVSWIFVGIIRGTFAEGPPGLIVLLSPFFFASAATIVVTLIQLHNDVAAARERTSGRSDRGEG